MEIFRGSHWLVARGIFVCENTLAEYGQQQIILVQITKRSQTVLLVRLVDRVQVELRLIEQLLLLATIQELVHPRRSLSHRQHLFHALRCGSKCAEMHPGDCNAVPINLDNFG